MIEHLNNIFHALADPTRRQIIAMLMESDSRTIKDLASPFKMSLAAVSKHINVLERARLVHRYKLGRDNHLKLNPEPLRQAQDWLNYYQRFWAHKLDQLDELIGGEDKKRKARPLRRNPKTPTGKRRTRQ